MNNYKNAIGKRGGGETKMFGKIENIELRSDGFF